MKIIKTANYKKMALKLNNDFSEDDMKPAYESKPYTRENEDEWVNEERKSKYSRPRFRGRDKSLKNKWDQVLKDMKEVEVPALAKNTKSIKTANYKKHRNLLVISKSNDIK